MTDRTEASMLKSICVATRTQPLSLVSVTLLVLLPACVSRQAAEQALGTQGGAAACAVGSSTDPLVVATDKGLVKGTTDGSGVAFLGIPFAKPPTGALRFMPPEPAACWSDVVDATQYGNTCAQFNGVVIGSEDCLNLNVWVPALPSSTSAPLPVLMWMYGGGNLLGGTNFGLSEFDLGQNIYDGQALANAQNAVVVSFNYRVGVLGFLAHPALTASTPQHTSGNYGLLDALLALQWVQDNIASFGGDKTRVMLFGQSAGAINTCALLASPLAHGLFSSALMESGNCAAAPLAHQYVLGAQIADAVSCSGATDVAACLQNAPLAPLVEIGGIGFVATFVEQLTSALDPKQLQTLPFGPTVDGYVLDDVPLATIQAGKHNHVPLVIGTNAQELDFVAIPLAIVGCAGAAALVSYWFPTSAPQLLAAYPCNVFDPASPQEEVGQAMTDSFFTCPSRRAARAAAATQTEPVYRYLWTHVTPYLGVAEVAGAFHGSEVPYVFGTFGGLLYAPTPAESALSQQMQSSWANLAASGNPNGGGLSTWSTYNPTADNILRLDTPIEDISAFEATGCDFWDTVQ
jgi:para-nitrobenzyl esterase